MNYDYDIVTIGLGPAGMAVSVMGSEMGLRVAAIERRKIGGECMNVGCIPSKALLRMAKIRHAVTKFPKMQLADAAFPDVLKPFESIQQSLQYINDAKTTKMFDKVDLLLAEGDAEFVDPHTIKVGDKKITAKRIFIAVGTRPAAPPIPGLDTIDYLTNENIFTQDNIPASMTIIGGGAIGSEMAQAFSRLGCKVTIVHMDPHLVPIGDPEAAELLEKQFKDENIDVYNSRMIAKVENTDDGMIALETDQGERIVSQRLLLGAGRRFDFSALKLDNAGVKVGKRGIEVDKYLRTSRKHIYAVGDCNGHFLLSHAAMHQGMIALMNTMIPWPMKMKFKNYVVPWTVFTEPQISCVGKTEKELKIQGTKYETIQVRYEDYGAAIAENIETGFVKVFASKYGKIYGASIVGEGSGEMINEWGFAIQHKKRLHHIMLLQHSFPTMGFLTKRIGESWMMNLMNSGTMMKRMMQFMYRL